MTKYYHLPFGVNRDAIKHNIESDYNPIVAKQAMEMAKNDLPLMIRITDGYIEVFKTHSQTKRNFKMETETDYHENSNWDNEDPLFDEWQSKNVSSVTVNFDLDAAWFTMKDGTTWALHDPTGKASLILKRKKAGEAVYHTIGAPDNY